MYVVFGSFSVLHSGGVGAWICRMKIDDSLSAQLGCRDARPTAKPIAAVIFANGRQERTMRRPPTRSLGRALDADQIRDGTVDAPCAAAPVTMSEKRQCVIRPAPAAISAIAGRTSLF